MISRSLIFGLFLLPAFALAQQDSLPVGPGDTVHIQVLEAPELEQHIRVSDSGEVHLFVGGDVKIAGESTAEAARTIQNTLIAGEYVNNPHVSISVENYATLNVSVVGQVKTPGSFLITSPRMVLDVLSMAGGLTDLGDRRITIQRRATKEEVHYFLSNSASAALSDNVRVFPGDTIVVSKVDVVYVLGDVHRPGGYAMSTNDGKMSVLQAVTLAGATNNSAVPSSARLIHKQADGSYTEAQINVSKMQKGKIADIAMRPDDILYIPFSYIRNMGSNLSGLVASVSTAAIYQF
jgi:polysaccharide export outer membrane protein